MGQVRDVLTSDGPALTEWVARKLHNHNPMRQRSKGRGEVMSTKLALDIDKQTVHYVSADGQAFDITVTARGHVAELAPAEQETLELRKYKYADWVNERAVG